MPDMSKCSPSPLEQNRGLCNIREMERVREKRDRGGERAKRRFEECHVRPYQVSLEAKKSTPPWPDLGYSLSACASQWTWYLRTAMVLFFQSLSPWLFLTSTSSAYFLSICPPFLPFLAGVLHSRKPAQCVGPAGRGEVYLPRPLIPYLRGMLTGAPSFPRPSPSARGSPSN